MIKILYKHLLDKNNLPLFSFGVILSLVSKGSALFSFTFNIDDIIFWSRPYDYYTLLPSAIRDGRFIFPFLGWAEELLGINPPLSFTISTLFFIACISVSAVLVCYIWGIHGNITASLIVVGFISLHPYLTDFFTWRVATFNGGLPFVLSLLSLLMARHSGRLIPIAVILFSLSLGIHQIPLQFCAATIACAALFSSLRYSGVIGCNSIAFELAPELYRLCRMTITLILGLLIYIVIAKLYISSFDVETLQRDKLIIFSDPGLIVLRVHELLYLTTLSDPLISNLSRVFFLVLFFIVTWGIFRKDIRISIKIIYLFFLIFSLFAAYLLSIALSVVSVAWVPVFRNIFSVSLLWATIAALSYLSTNQSMQKISIALTVLLFISFAAKDNEILTDQMRANQRDTLMMNRIASDIEKLPNFKSVNGLVFLGTKSSSLQKLRSSADLSIGWHNYGTTLSLFAIPWNGYLVAFFNELTGHELSQVDREKFKHLCNKTFWPSVGSVFSYSNTAIVCLGEQQEIVFPSLDARSR